MLISNAKQEELLREMKGLALEIDLQLVTHNITWAINSIVDLGRQASDPDDKTNYFTQIEAISDCLRWAAKIKELSDQIECTEEMEATIRKGGPEC
jgi:hypothetical protein